MMIAGLSRQQATAKWGDGGKPFTCVMGTSLFYHICTLVCTSSVTLTMMQHIFAMRKYRMGGHIIYMYIIRNSSAFTAASVWNHSRL